MKKRNLGTHYNVNCPKKRNQFLKARRGLAGFQIYLMIVSVVALAFILGSSFEAVSVSGQSQEEKFMLKINGEITTDYYVGTYDSGGNFYYQGNLLYSREELESLPGGSIKVISLNDALSIDAEISESDFARLQENDFLSVDSATGAETPAYSGASERPQPTVTQTPARTAGKDGLEAYVLTAGDGKVIEVGDHVTLEDGSNVRVSRMYADGTVELIDDQGNAITRDSKSLKSKEESPPPKATTGGGGFTWKGLYGHTAIEGVGLAVSLAGFAQTIGAAAGLSSDNTNALTIAFVGGQFSYYLIHGALGEEGLLGSYGSKKWSLSQEASGLLAVVAAVVIFALLYKKEKSRYIRFTCLPWEAPLGGENCELCNNDPNRPCSEYRCKSLGQACELVNPGSTEERCVWVSPDDVNSPIIETWTDALKPNFLKYTPDKAIRPPQRGVKIVDERDSDGCLPAFTPLEFGIVLNEPAQCKVDWVHTDSFEDMDFYIGESNFYRYNHTQKMKLPGPETETIEDGAVNGSADPDPLIEGESPVLENDGEYSMFVRCQDANGNENVDEFVFNFCVQAGPDTTPPIIVDTSVPSGSPIGYEFEELNLEVYVNEPAECKWSRQDKSYDNMENEMSCENEPYELNADLNYVCNANLTGISKNQVNDFYFRCKDNPNKEDSQRNVNAQSLHYTLRGSEPLNILEVGPNSTVKSNTATAVVELTAITDDGANQGEATCFYSPEFNVTDEYIAMYETDNFEHKQELDLNEGQYTYFFRCIDEGGNLAEANTTFVVDLDDGAPQITRTYKEGADALKVITDEDAECVYSLDSCNYEYVDGINLVYSDPSIRTSHFVKWDTNNAYYIKCKDDFGNLPLPNTCNLIVSPTEFSGN